MPSPLLRVTGGAPYFLPWLPLVKRLQEVDVFLATPCIQFTKHDNFVHRTKLRDAWLTVPTLKCASTALIREVEIIPGTVAPLAKSLQNAIGGKYPYRSEIEPFLSILAGSSHRFLLGIPPQVLIPIHLSGQKAPRFKGFAGTRVHAAQSAAR